MAQQQTQTTNPANNGNNLDGLTEEIARVRASLLTNLDSLSKIEARVTAVRKSTAAALWLKQFIDDGGEFLADLKANMHEIINMCTEANRHALQEMRGNATASPTDLSDQIQKVTAELERLSQEVNDRLAAVEEKVTRHDIALFDEHGNSRLAMQDAGIQEVYRVIGYQRGDGNNPPRTRFDEVLEEQRRLADEQQRFGSAQHRTESEVIGLTTTVFGTPEVPAQGDQTAVPARNGLVQSLGFDFQTGNARRIDVIETEVSIVRRELNTLKNSRPDIKSAVIIGGLAAVLVMLFTLLLSGGNAGLAFGLGVAAFAIGMGVAATFGVHFGARGEHTNRGQNNTNQQTQQNPVPYNN